MIPVRDSARSKEWPVITVTLCVLNIAIYLWDRGGNILGSSIFLGDLAVRPREIMLVLEGRGDPTSLVTLCTSMFLHGNLAHIIGNLMFLYVFGENLEAVLGPVRFALYYVLWGIVATMTHIWVDPSSSIPMLGASGAIGGVLGAYFLLFPGNRIRFFIFPFLFWELVVSAWILLGIWFLGNIVFPQQGVANWAHAGGFFAGMVTVLIIGGREKALAGKEFEQDPDAD